ACVPSFVCSSFCVSRSGGPLYLSSFPTRRSSDLSAEDAVWLAGQGILIGFGGACTFKGAKRAGRAIDALPLESILLETDCPYMAPEPVRGARCDSSLIAYVGEYIAQRKGVPADTVFAQTAANDRRVISLMYEPLTRRCLKAAADDRFWQKQKRMSYQSSYPAAPRIQHPLPRQRGPGQGQRGLEQDD